MLTVVQVIRRNKQSRLIVGHVGGGEKSVASIGGAEKQETQLGDALFLREVKCSSGKNLTLELASLGFES